MPLFFTDKLKPGYDGDIADAVDIEVASSGFDGLLTVAANDVQKVAEAFDNLSVYRVRRFTRTQTSDEPLAPTSNAVPNAYNRGNWQATYSSPTSTERYTWAAVKIGIGTDPADTTEWLILPVESYAASSVGLTQTQVDARINALVANWATVASGARAPASKMAWGFTDVPVANGGIVSVVNARQNISAANAHNAAFTATYNVASTGSVWAMVGILTTEITTIGTQAIVWSDGTRSPTINNWTRLGVGTAGNAVNFTYYETQFTGGVPSGAAHLEEGQLIPVDILPQASATGSGIISAADYARIQGAHNQAGVDARIAAAVEDFAEVSKPNATMPDGRLSPHMQEVSNSFDGGGWTDSTTAGVAVNTGAGNIPLLHGTRETSLATVRGFTYSATPADVSPRLTNQYAYFRLPISAVGDEEEWRLSHGVTGAAAYLEIADATRIGADAAYTYYSTDQIADIPVGALFRVQQFTLFELDDHRVRVTAEASNVSVDASGFNGNLDTADTNVQAVAQKLDDLVISSNQILGATPNDGVFDIQDMSDALRAIVDPEYAITSGTRGLVAAVETRFNGLGITNVLHQSGATVGQITAPVVSVDLPSVYDRSARAPSQNTAVNRTVSFDHGMRAEAFGQGGTRAQGFRIYGLPPLTDGKVMAVAITGRLPSNFAALGSADFANNSMVLLSFGQSERVVPATPNIDDDLVIKENGGFQIERNHNGISRSGTNDATALGNGAYFKVVLMVRKVAGGNVWQYKYSVNGRAVKTSPASGGGAIVNTQLDGATELAIGNGMSRGEVLPSFKGDLWDCWIRMYDAADFPISDGDLQAYSGNGLTDLTAGTYNTLSSRNNPYSIGYGQITGAAVALKYQRSWRSLSTGVLTIPRLSQGGYLHVVFDEPFNINDADSMRFGVSVDGADGAFVFNEGEITRGMVRTIAQAVTKDANTIRAVVDSTGAAGWVTNGNPLSSAVNRVAMNLIGDSAGSEVVTGATFFMDNEHRITANGVRLTDLQVAG